MLINQGVIPPVSPVAALRGGDTLDPEKSTSYTLGGYFSAGPFEITVDYFDIDVKDRLSLSSDFSLIPGDVILLAGQGIDASDIADFRFFTNQFDTNTSGAGYRSRIKSYSRALETQSRCIVARTASTVW